MNAKFRHVALLGRYELPTAGGSRPASRRALERIAHFLHTQGCEVHLERQTSANAGMSGYSSLSVPEIGQQCDLGLVVGGDGTMLGYARELSKYKVPLIGINQGRLGFITDIPLEDFESTLKPMLQGEYEVDRRPLMQARVWRDGLCVMDALAMNDVVINRGSTSGMVELRVEFDGNFVANQRADGLIISSPTGATAYSLSVGGPLMHPSLPAWIVPPIAPHTLSNRPIVLADTGEVAVDLVAGRDASANFDMQSLAALLLGDRITVRRSDLQAVFLHPLGWSYYDTLRKKLHWNEGVT